MLVELRSGFAFPEAIDVVAGDEQVDAFPCPIEVGVAFPAIPAFVREAGISRYAGQVAIEISAGRKRARELREQELVKIRDLGERSEGAPRGLALILQAEVHAPRGF